MQRLEEQSTSRASGITDCPDEFLVDSLVQATGSEQRIGLLGSLDGPTNLVDLRERVMRICGYSPASYYISTLQDQIRCLPPGIVAVDRTPDPETTIANLTDTGVKGAALGGFLLERLVKPSENLSLVHIYSHPSQRHEDTPPQLSSHWRVFKLLETMLADLVTCNDMFKLYRNHSSVITLDGVTKMMRRLQSVGFTIGAGHEGKRKVWQLTERGQEVAQPLVESVHQIARNTEGSSVQQGLTLLSKFTSPRKGKSPLPAIIREAKLAGNKESKRLIEINRLLARIASSQGGIAVLSTSDISNKLGGVTSVQLTRVLEQVPESVIKSVCSRTGGHEGNTWELRLDTPRL